MRCPYCGYAESKVIDSRPTDEGARIRRRRECLSCAKRFTTYEIIESLPIIVVKKDTSREAFDRNKLLNGLLRACEKRPVPLETLEKAVDEIEAQIQNSLDREVTADRIGEYAMEKLKAIDEIAYVRFASLRISTASTRRSAACWKKTEPSSKTLPGAAGSFSYSYCIVDQSIYRKGASECTRFPQHTQRYCCCIMRRYC